MIETRDSRQLPETGRTLPKGMRLFAWAGWLLPVPSSFRMYQIGGNHRRGTFGLADEKRPRIEFAWDTVTGRRFDFGRFSSRKLARSVKRKPSEIREEWETLVGPTFEPFVCCQDPDANCERYVGFVAGTRRLLHVVHHLQGDERDRVLRGAIRTQLQDQPLEAGQRWAFFGISFITPKGFEYEDAKLDLGDMSVILRQRCRGRQPRLVVRQIYPAKLALARNNLQEWLENILRREQSIYVPRYRNRFLRRGVLMENHPTSLGPALVSDSYLPLALRPFKRWRHYTVQRTWLIHDQDHDRLTVIQVNHHPDRLQSMLDLVLGAMHWVSRADG